MSVKLLVAVVAGLYESVTLAVKVKLPVEVAIPWIEPSVPSVKPGGKVPLVLAQVYGGSPPLASND
jgi:hypothetical protein